MSESLSMKLGWPFDVMGPKREPTSLSLDWAVAFAILAGWWMFVLLQVCRDTDAVVVPAGFLFLSVILLVGNRIIRYLGNYRPPINLWGRIRTFRWIIPRYDLVFIAPALIMILASSLKWLVLDFKLPIDVVLPLVMVLIYLTGLCCPPRLERWRLTGNHRIVPSPKGQEMQQLP